MLKKYFKNPLSLVLVLIFVLGIGVYSIFTLPIKMYPNMVKPSFTVSYGDSELNGPHDVLTTYGNNIIGQIKNIKGLEFYTTSYYKNSSQIQLEFEWNVDQEVIKEKLQSILSTISATKPRYFWQRIRSRSSQSSSNMMIAVAHKTFNSEELQELLENSLSQELKKIDNVENVGFYGWDYEKLVLEVDRTKLLSFNLSIDQIISSIVKSLKSVSIGRIGPRRNRQQSQQLTIDAKVSNTEQLLNVPIILNLEKNINIKVKDIAKVGKIKEESDSLFRLNGNAANYMSVTLKAKGDVKKTCDIVEEKLKQFKNITPDISFNIIVNPSVFIEMAIRNLLINALLGGLAAVCIIFLFLRSWSNTIVVGISIPFCIITSFILMKISGVTINIISLGGMAIGVGMILDSSIVTLENIYRRINEQLIKNKTLSIDERIDIIIRATKEVALPIITSILTSIVVFLPIIYTTSYTQAILGDLAKTVVFTLTTSIIAALIIVPVASQSIASSKTTKKDNFKLVEYYQKIISYFLESKKKSILLVAISFIIFFISLFLIPKIKKEIIAIPATKLFDISFSLPDNKDISLTRKYILEVERYLKNKPEVLNYSTYMWNPSNGYITAELIESSLFEKLKTEFQDKFPHEPDIKRTPMKWDPGGMPLPRQNDLIMHISGASDDELTSFSDRVMSKSSEIKGNIRRTPWISKSESISIDFKPWIMKNDTSTITKFLKASSKNGIFIGHIFDGSNTRSISFMFNENQRANYQSDIENLPISFSNKIVPLKTLANIKSIKSSYTPRHYVEEVRTQEIFVNFRKNKDKIKKETKIENLKKIINKMDKPFNINIFYPDPNKEINKSYNSFKYSLLISISLVFLILALLFNSVKYPLIIIGTVPLAIIGILSGLYITKSTISLNSMLGTILLTGLVANNAILLVDFYLKSRKSNQSNLQSILEATKLRFRPIMMTTLTTLLGVIPIALAFGESGEILQPLGISIFFGLLISTLLTLLIIPAFLNIFSK